MFFITLLRHIAKDVKLLYGINAMMLMLQIFNVAANKNARYKCNELEFIIAILKFLNFVVYNIVLMI